MIDWHPYSLLTVLALVICINSDVSLNIWWFSSSFGLNWTISTWIYATDHNLQTMCSINHPSTMFYHWSIPLLYYWFHSIPTCLVDPTLSSWTIVLLIELQCCSMLIKHCQHPSPSYPIQISSGDHLDPYQWYSWATEIVASLSHQR